METDVIAAALGNGASLARLRHSDEFEQEKLQTMLDAAAGGGLLLPLKALLSRSDVDVNYVGNANWMALRLCYSRGSD